MSEARDSQAQRSATPLPLAGVRVLDVTQVMAGPYACMLLADLGADVIAVERPSPSQGQARPSEIVHRGKRSLALDLKHPRARDVVLGLLDNADVLIEGMRPGVMERLGLGPDECRAQNPKLVYARMTGWGQS
ncbi:MAG: CoA transferase, partial [Cupriavidus sp.]